MATRRPPDLPAVGDVVVPADLLDHDAPAWHQQAVFARWFGKHLPPDRCPLPARVQDLLDSDWTNRFEFAVSAWAVAYEITRRDYPKFPDRDRLAELGVVKVSPSERNRSLGIRAAEWRPLP